MPKPSPSVRFRLAEVLAAADPPISQLALAKRSGVSQVTVNAIANNRTTRVDLATLDKLCGALGKFLLRNVEPGELLDYKPKGAKR